MKEGITMTQSIQKFMQQEDHNGEWLNCTDYAYMRETIYNWLDEGLELNNRIKGYLDHLEQYA
jgi:hypothetical protein